MGNDLWRGGINLQPYEILCATISNSASIHLSYLVTADREEGGAAGRGEIWPHFHKVLVLSFNILHSFPIFTHFSSCSIFTRGFKVQMAKQDRRYTVQVPIIHYQFIHILWKRDLYTLFSMFSHSNRPTSAPWAMPVNYTQLQKRPSCTDTCTHIVHPHMAFSIRMCITSARSLTHKQPAALWLP